MGQGPAMRDNDLLLHGIREVLASQYLPMRIRFEIDGEESRTKPTTNHRRREAGLARARPLTPESRSEIARKAVERRFEHNCPY